MSAQQLRPPTCFAHGDRVLSGANRAPGRLMRCEGRNGEYWKVKLDAGGAWVWPDRIVLATKGSRVAVCEMGEGRFMTDEQGDGLLCPRHNDQTFGSIADHALDAAAPRRPSGNTHRWIRGRGGRR